MKKFAFFNLSLFLYCFSYLDCIVNLKIFNESRNAVEIELTTPYNRIQKVESKKIIFFSSNIPEKLSDKINNQFILEPSEADHGF